MNTKYIQDPQILELTIYTCLAFLLMALVLILFFYFSRKKIIQIEIDKKDLEISHQKELVKSIILTQEKERKRIAQDLHDEINSKLNIISINTHLLNTKNLTEIEKKAITNTIINNTKSVSEDSRRIAHDLLPPVLQNFGLHAGIEELCQELSNTKTVNIIYKNYIIFDKNYNFKHLQIFRILQELLNNSLRHGKSKNILITFTLNANKILLIYQDDGIGFKVSSLENKKGLGMKNIESRINFLNGVLEIVSNPNQGAIFTIKFEL